MTIDAQVQELLERRTSAIELSGLAGVDDIAGQAVARTRRTRVVGGLATVVAVVVMLVGVGTALRDPEPSAVFAGDGNVPLVPASVVAVDGGYVGVAIPDEPIAPFAVEKQHVVVQSGDGETWRPVEDLPPMDALVVVAAHHDGVFHFVATRERGVQPDDEESSFELVHYQTADLEEFEVVVQRVPEELELVGHTPWPIEVVAAGPGVALAVRTNPRWNEDMDDALAAAGVAIEDVCDITGTASQMRYRLCGTEDHSTVEFDPPVSVPSIDDYVLFARPGERFDLVTLPDTEPGVFAGPRSSMLYATTTGLGIVGAQSFETTDGDSWELVETGDDVGPMIATRDEERVFRSQGPVQRFGPDDPVIGMAYSPDGETWEESDIFNLYDMVIERPRFFYDLQSGPAGWAFVAQRPDRGPHAVEGVERATSGRESDFAVTKAGYQLRGRAPYGPATLTDRTGAVVRSWTHFEVQAPEWSGLIIESAGLTVPDEDTGEAIVTFTAQQWSAIAEPDGEPNNEFDLLFSANGQDWSIIDTAAVPQNILAVGTDEVLIRSVTRDHFVPWSVSIEVVAVDVSPDN